MWMLLRLIITSILVNNMMGTLEIGVCNRPADGHLNTLNK